MDGTAARRQRARGILQLVALHREVAVLYTPARVADGSAVLMRARPRLRVVHVGKFYPPVAGGMERVLESLCEGSAPDVDSRVIVCNTDARDRPRRPAAACT